MENTQDRFEEVKATLGFDIPLSKDPYSKEKASVFISFTMGGNQLDRKEYTKEATRIARELTEETKEILKAQGEEVKLGIEELRNTRSPEIDKLREELSNEYDEKLKKAKEIILEQREKIKLLKEKNGI
jgi:gas vesicle protein